MLAEIHDLRKQNENLRQQVKILDELVLQQRNTLEHYEDSFVHLNKAIDALNIVPGKGEG